MAWRLAWKFRKASHLADTVTVHCKLDDHAVRFFVALLANGRVKRLPVLGDLEVRRPLAAVDRLHDFRSTSFGVAFENLERVLVWRARVASDDAVYGGGYHGVHFPLISL